MDKVNLNGRFSILEPLNWLLFPLWRCSETPLLRRALRASSRASRAAAMPQRRPAWRGHGVGVPWRPSWATLGTQPAVISCMLEVRASWGAHGVHLTPWGHTRVPCTRRGACRVAPCPFRSLVPPMPCACTAARDRRIMLPGAGYSLLTWQRFHRPSKPYPARRMFFFLRLPGRPGHARLEPRGPWPLPRHPIEKHRAARGVRERRAEYFPAREPCRESWLGLTGRRESTAFGVAGGDGHH